MGYACPVCDIPQADGTHLANHLAFTAILGRADHEAWLDEHAPGWGEQGPRALAGRVAPYAREMEYPQVFEDTVDRSAHRGDEPRPGDLFDDEPERGGRGDLSATPGSAAPMDPDVQQILDEARKMTEEMLADEGEEGESEKPEKAGTSEDQPDDDAGA